MKIKLTINRNLDVFAWFLWLSPLFYLPHLFTNSISRYGLTIPPILQFSVVIRDALVLFGISYLFFSNRFKVQKLSYIPIVLLVIVLLRLIVDLVFIDGGVGVLVLRYYDFIVALMITIFFTTIKIKNEYFITLVEGILKVSVLVFIFGIIEYLNPGIAVFAKLDRIRSTLYSPTTLGGFALLCFVSSAVLTAYRGNKFYVLIALINMVTIYLSGSRTVIIAAILCLLILGIYIRKIRNVILTILLLAVPVVILKYNLILEKISESRALSMLSFDVLVNDKRFDDLRLAVSEMRAYNYLFGNGINPERAPVDLTWIYMLFTFGILAFFTLLLIWLIGTYKMIIIKTNDIHKLIVSRIILMVLICCFIILITTNLFATFPTNIMIFSIMGLALNSSVYANNNN